MSRADLWQELRAEAPLILPSLLLCDFGNLQLEVERLEEAGVRALHLDVMDGQFVPNLTYGMPIVAALRKLTRMPLDVHLMIQQPERYIRAFAEAGADALTVHIEATSDPRGLLRAIREEGLLAGLALNPATPLASIEPVLDACDLTLVMSVSAGFGGQSFQPIALEKLRQLRAAAGPRLWLEVDGGINQDTVGPCTAAGAELLVVGSAIFRQPDYTSAVRTLRQRASASSRPDGETVRP